MKKILLIISVALLSFNNQAQPFALKLGVNFANMSATYMGDADSYNASSGIDRGYVNNLGFHLGVLGELPLNEMLSLESGIQFTTKGYKNKENLGTFLIVVGTHIAPKQSINFLYMDIPVSLKAKFEINDDSDSYFYVSAGAYFGLGLAAVSEFEPENDEEFLQGSGPIEFGSDEISDFSRIDYGLSVGIGVEKSRYIFGFYYDLGLANVSSTYEDFNELLSQKHKGFKFSFGYRLLKE